jgi:hypothetical protein
MEQNDMKQEQKHDEKAAVDNGKEYRKQYYLKNRNEILKRKTEQKERAVLQIAQLQSVKLHDITEKLNKDRYQKVEGRTRLSLIKTDYKVLKALFKDKNDVVYNQGIFESWLLKFDSLIKKHETLMTDIILKNYLGL